MVDSEHPKTKRAKRSNDARFPVASPLFLVFPTISFRPPVHIFSHQRRADPMPTPPQARIKRLIQADEEVGKVAQATPVLVSKALELFLDQLIQELVKDAQARHVQKISAHTLKRVIDTVPTFDFLSELVQHVPDPIQAEQGADRSNVEGDKKPRTAAAVAATGSRSSGRKGKSVARLGDYATGEEGSGDEAAEGRVKDDDDEYDE